MQCLYLPSSLENINYFLLNFLIQAKWRYVLTITLQQFLENKLILKLMLNYFKFMKFTTRDRNYLIILFMLHEFVTIIDKKSILENSETLSIKSRKNFD